MSEPKVTIEHRGAPNRFPGLSQEYPPYEVAALEASIQQKDEQIASLRESVKALEKERDDFKIYLTQCKQRDAEIEMLKKKQARQPGP